MHHFSLPKLVTSSIRVNGKNVFAKGVFSPVPLNARVLSQGEVRRGIIKGLTRGRGRGVPHTPVEGTIA